MDYNVITHWGIKGMKWGVRRYQNKDGSLTDAGKRRLERDRAESNNAKLSADPKKWDKQDTERAKKLVDSSASTVRTVRNSISSKKQKPRMDLSSMSDQEMRNRINRELLERQYNDMFAPEKVSKGKSYALKTLDVAGTVLGIGSSALGIALAIKELKG